MARRVLIGSLLVFIVGCGSTAKPKSNGASADSTSATEMAEKLVAIWEGACGKTDEGVTKKVITIGRSAINFSTYFYADEDVECKAVRILYKLQGVWGVKKQLVSAPVGFDFNYKTEKALRILYQDDDVTKANAEAACGKSDWTKGKETDVTESDCAKGLATTYDLVQIIKGGLVLGQKTTELDGSHAEKRPKELDRSVVYSRKE